MTLDLDERRPWRDPHPGLPLVDILHALPRTPQGLPVRVEIVRPWPWDRMMGADRIEAQGHRLAELWVAHVAQLEPREPRAVRLRLLSADEGEFQPHA